jgi:AcrR family transcriptional regulator
MSSKVQELPWQGEPLPRGRHKLGADEVRASQRERISRAMIECVARDGYEATTVTKVVRAARVSRNAFYEIFADKTDCFLVTTTEAGNELLEEMLALQRQASWLDALRLGTDLYLHWWQDRPAFGRAYFLGLAAVGERAREQLDLAYGRFAAMFHELGRRARAEQPDLEPLPAIVPRVLVFAITEMVADEIRAGRGDRLIDLREPLFALMVKLLADDETAQAAVS